MRAVMMEVRPLSKSEEYEAFLRLDRSSGLLKVLKEKGRK